MALKVPTASAITFLNWWLNYASDKCRLHLFKSNTTPADTDTLATYTEADFPGYASVLMSGWASAGTVAGRATLTANPCVFTNSTGGGAAIYGYYVTDYSSTILLWSERDPLAPVSVTVSGQTYTVNPVFTAKSEF